MNKYVNESLPKEQRLGQVGVNNKGKKMTIIAYRKSNDIDIEFEDGSIVYNKKYYNFTRGVIMYPIKDRIGEINYNKKNEKMTIIAYRKSNDIDVQFEDGSIAYNKTYSDFKNKILSHPIKYKDTIAHYITEILNIDLDKIWNWEKNNENGINPYKITCGSDKKIWLYCQEHDYHNDYGGYEIACSNFTKGKGCSYCKGQYKLHYKDSLAYKYPQIAKMIAIKENDLTFEDCYSIACYSNEKFYFKCLECETISDRQLALYSIIKRGYPCRICGDGISMPNKIAYNILTQLNINFKSEYSPYYFKNNQHTDFLLIDYNMILEMDGCFGNHTKEYDYWRDFLNMKYGGYKTIRIDLTDKDIYRNDTLNYIKEQILNSELSNIFNLSDIDWKLVWEQCQKSKCVETWELWNNDFGIEEISRITRLSRHTVREYLKRGNECEKCKYTIEESIKRGAIKRSSKNHHSSTKVICITTKKIFNTITEAGYFYNIKSSNHIGSCCNGRRKYCGKLEDGTKLKWMYYEDYLKLED